MKLSTARVGLSVVLLVALGACNSPESAENAEAKTADPGAASATPGQEKKRKRRVKKDRGDASMKIGDVLWQAKSAKAAIKSGSLRINASRMDMSGGKATRQQLSLILPDYKGPGSYEVRAGGSMFVGVGLNTDELKEGETDEKIKEVTTKAVSKATTIMMMKATAVVETANDKEIVGTFSQPAIGNYPEIAEGKFRALVTESK